MVRIKVKGAPFHSSTLEGFKWNSVQRLPYFCYLQIRKNDGKRSFPSPHLLAPRHCPFSKPWLGGNAAWFWRWRRKKGWGVESNMTPSLPCDWKRAHHSTWWQWGGTHPPTFHPYSPSQTVPDSHAFNGQKVTKPWWWFFSGTLCTGSGLSAWVWLTDRDLIQSSVFLLRPPTPKSGFTEMEPCLLRKLWVHFKEGTKELLSNKRISY